MHKSLLPARLKQILKCRDALQQEQIYFAPIRHHSPACSYAIRQLISQVKPTHVLIEAPSSFAGILDHLLNKQTRPPIAILCQTNIELNSTNTEQKNDNSQEDQSICSSFYPFCDYSPEWQAMQLAKDHNATIQFIDLPWNEQANLKNKTQQGESLLSETYLKHSQYIKYLMQKLHCRDHNEVWEHLFELRDFKDITNWQNFFQDTLIWCAMARLDYQVAELEAEGSAQREQYMLTAIGQLKNAQPDAKIVVVTGGFHTFALLEGLWKNKFVTPTKSAITRYNRQQANANKDNTWLIRYSFDRLDALNGYASGMLSPAYYQDSWTSMLAYEQEPISLQTTQNCRQQQALHFVSNLAKNLRERQSNSEIISFIQLQSAVEQAARLAKLREHYGPGRYDLLDGIQSSFIKGSIDDARSDFWQIVHRCLSGSLLGQIPTGMASPPLVNQVYSLLKKYRFKLGDTLIKLTHIDIYRKPEHRQRSRFLHLLDFLNVGLAKRLDGPDYIYGQRLTIMFEDWQYAWTPLVEARLIELSQQGTSLEQIAIQQLHQQIQRQIENGQARSSVFTVHCVMQAALMGLQNDFEQLLINLVSYLEVDSDLSSIVDCGHRLLYLWQGRNFLEINSTETLLALLAKVPQQAFFLLDIFKRSDEEIQQQNLKILLSLRDLLNNLPEQLNVKQLKQDFYQNLCRLKPLLVDTHLLRGAIDSISYLDSQINQQQLESKIKGAFGVGAQNQYAVEYFKGMMECTPELIIQSSFLLNSIDELLAHWDQEKFIAFLPDLRFVFSQLTPKQNAFLAEKIAKKYSAEQSDLTFQQNKFSEAELQKALSLELTINQRIKQQQLQDWFKL